MGKSKKRSLLSNLFFVNHYKFGNEETIGGLRVSFHIGCLPARF